MFSSGTLSIMKIDVNKLSNVLFLFKVKVIGYISELLITATWKVSYNFLNKFSTEVETIISLIKSVNEKLIDLFWGYVKQNKCW